MGSATVVAITKSILPTTCFGVGSYLLVCAVIEVITSDFHILCGKTSIEKGKEMKKLFSNIIEAISEIKQLSLLFNKSR